MHEHELTPGVEVSYQKPGYFGEGLVPPIVMAASLNR